MHLDAAQSASGCIAHLDAGPFSGIFLHWHLDASLPCGIGIEMQALFLASQFKMLHCVRSGRLGDERAAATSAVRPLACA